MIPFATPSLGRGALLIQLLSSASFLNASWTGNPKVNRFAGPWLFAPIQPSITQGVPAISNTYQSLVFDNRQDYHIDGRLHYSPANTALLGAFGVNGGRKGVIRAITHNNTAAGRIAIQKMAQAVHAEGFYADFGFNPDDQDGLFMGGAGGAKITASINGYSMSVTARSGLNYNGEQATLIGDCLIGGTLRSGTGVTVGTKVVDWGKVNVIGSLTISAGVTTLTTTSEVGAPIIPGYANASGSDGMMVVIDGGIEVGVITAGSPGSWTVDNAKGYTVPAGSRIFVECRGGIGSYVLDTSHASLGAQFVDYYPPTAGYYGVPSDVPADRLSKVALSYGPIITRQTNAVINTHGSNLCKYLYGGNAGSGLNSGKMSSLQQTGAVTCDATLLGPIQAATGTNKGAWAKNTAYLIGDYVTSNNRTYVALTNHTSGNLTGTTFDTERQLRRWVGLNSTIMSWYPMGTWTASTVYQLGDVVKSGTKLYFCTNGHTASGAFSTDLARSGSSKVWSDMVGWTFKITATGYDTGSGPVVKTIGNFNRDWVLSSNGITVGDGTNGTVIPLTSDTSYTGDMAAISAFATLSTTYTFSGVVTSPQIIFTGAPLNGALPLDGTEPGEHADSLGQQGRDKFLAFLGTDLSTATSSYQAGGITSSSQTGDCTEETSRGHYKMVIGLTPGEDSKCTLSWSGMQSYVVKFPKRYWEVYADKGDRTWADFASLIMPSLATPPRATRDAGQWTITSGVDPASGKNFIAYGGGVYSGGWKDGAPTVPWVTPATSGFNYITGTAASGNWSYSNQRDPDANEMLSLSFQHDTGDTLYTAAAGTYIGWFDLTCAGGFPGAVASGDRCIVDMAASTGFVGVGSSSYGRRAVRGHQAIPLGNNPVYIDCKVLNTSPLVTKRFGPYNFPGAPSSATTTLAVVPLRVPTSVTTVAVCSFTLDLTGSGATSGLQDIIVAVVVENGSSRTITSVKIDGVTAAPINNAAIINSTQATRSEIWFYRASLTPSSGSITSVVTFNSTINGCVIYGWSCTGVGLVYDTSVVSASASNLGASTNIATPPGGAVLAVHSYSQGTVTANFRASAMTLAGTTSLSAQTISGTLTGTDVTKPTNLNWNVGTEFVSAASPGTPGSGDVTIKSGQTGASMLACISLSPGFSLEVNMIQGTLSNGTITQPASGYAVSVTGVTTVYSANTPRWDYNLGILRGVYIEPTRTNLCVQSQDASTADWTATAVAKTSTNNADPFGGTTALLMTADGTASAHYLIPGSGGTTVSYTTGQTYTISCYAKAGTTSFIQLAGNSEAFGIDAYANFDLSNGNFVSSAQATGTIRSLANGWYRISITVVATATVSAAAGIAAFIGTLDDARLPVITSSDTIYLGGWQTEVGTDRSTYIPTTTTAVTRVADILNITSVSKANGTYIARCWHQSGDYTDVTGVALSGGSATLTGVSTKPVQGITFV